MDHRQGGAAGGNPLRLDLNGFLRERLKHGQGERTVPVQDGPLGGQDAPPSAGGSCTKKQLRNALGWGLDRLNRICDILLEGNVIEIVPDTVTAGKGAKRTVDTVRKRITGT